MHFGFRPRLIHPLVMVMELVDHSPFLEASSTHSLSSSWMVGRLMKKCVVSLMTGGFLQILQR